MVVTLYTSRVILQALGVEDYGVYTAIGGIIAFLSMVTGPIDAAISRYLTYELGRGNQDRLRRYFSTGLTTMIIFAVLSVIILETAGIWFLNNKMVIDENRVVAANWVLHLSIAAFVINLISAPYRAAIIAHEKMSLFAYMGILDAVLKLAVAFSLMASPIDKLILYAILLLAVAIVVRFIYTIVCNKQFEECRSVKIGIDKVLFKGLFSFAGWNVFGAMATFCRGQGVNILFNLFGGPVVNAAYGIANQVNGAVASFVNNFTTALNPSIIKSYAAHEKDYMMSLVYQGARFSYFLVLFFAMPLILEAKYITQLWLGQTPDYSVVFIQLMLIYSLIESLSKTIMAGVHATGKIKVYQIVIGLFQVIILPIAYMLLRIGYSPIAVLIAMVVVDIIAVVARMIMANFIFGLSIKDYLISVIGRVFLVTIISLIIPLILVIYLNNSLLSFFVVVIVSIVMTAFSVFYIGCVQSERLVILNKIQRYIRKS
ncbi:MAG: lipopolysaccharide biosynthesis protein [Bacteroidaceae bacterium]|nr:lipopolysaccharide biosynthesis protein [Bacteroidaceae bacterium]